MSETSPRRSAKPGTSCLGCRRRKLKCSRETEGCRNCLKAELPCVYPAPESGVKRKRGPYKKDKPARERHLEDLVKYLEPKTGHSGSTADTSPDTLQHDVDGTISPTNTSPTLEHATGSFELGGRAGSKTSNSEDLVKDALIALTKSSVAEHDLGPENGISMPLPAQTANIIGGLGFHPPLRQIFDYWYLFVTRVDPLVKIFHRRTFEKQFFQVVDNLQTAGAMTESLLFSIYYSAVSSCTHNEARKRFGENREVLLQRYGRVIEAALADNYSMPTLESLQALVLYIVAIRRDDSISNIRALFSLAVRMAQLIGLHEDPGDRYTPFEAEMRRRLWWHICGLESRGAEEGSARQSSIMENCSVQLPANLNDVDLNPDSVERPQPRTGVTDISFALIRWDSLRLVHKLMEIKKRHLTGTGTFERAKLKEQQLIALDEIKVRMETYYKRYFHGSRPLDWLCMRWIEVMSIKTRLIVDYPFGQIPTKEMSANERFELLQSSVDIIRLSYTVAVDKKIDDWIWYFRGWVQWHSIAIVIAELGGNKNQNFVNIAWAVLDPILADWDKVYQVKKDEPAWEHVHSLIERAREMRREMRGTQAQQIVMPTSSTASSSNLATSSFLQMSNATKPDGTWPTNWTPFGSRGAPLPSFIPPNFCQQQLTTSDSVEVPFEIGCAPTIQGPEAADFGYIEGLDDIDFSAFDSVFGDAAWDFSSPSTDFNVETTTA